MEPPDTPASHASASLEMFQTNQSCIIYTLALNIDCSRLAKVKKQGSVFCGSAGPADAGAGKQSFGGAGVGRMG